MNNETELGKFGWNAKNLPAEYLDKHYLVTAELDLAGGVWLPVGTSDVPFTGVFDGGGHTIDGFVVPADLGYTAQGFFGYIGTTGLVKRLTVGADSVVGDAAQDGHDGVGAIAGYCEGRVEGCANLTAVNSRFTNLGGIVGVLDATVNAEAAVVGCTNGGVVDQSYGWMVPMPAGGVVGRNKGGLISGCTNSGSVTVSTNTEMYDPDIDWCYPCAGGIEGYGDGGGRVEDCANTGAILGERGHQRVGGISGYTADAVSGCTNSGSVSVTSWDDGSSRYIRYQYAGGIVGYSAAGVTDCENSDAVSMGSTSDKYCYMYAGGVVGGSTGTVSGCRNLATGTVSALHTTSSGVAAAGGVVGRGDGAQVRLCENDAAVSTSTGTGTGHTRTGGASRASSRTTRRGS